MLGLRRFAPFSLPPRVIIDQSKSANAKFVASYWSFEKTLYICSMIIEQDESFVEE